MNETIVYNVFHKDAYGYLVLIYFFLAGIIALVMVSLGGIFLWLDLGRLERVYLLFLKFHVTSPISWGGIIISLYSLCTVAYLYFLLIAKDEARARLFAKAGIFFAIALMTYTGFLLSMAKARPLWHSAIMAPLFLVSGGISGLAMILLVANALGYYPPKDDVMRTLSRALIILILIDIFFLSDMYVLYIGIAEATEVALLLLVGKFAFLFWGIELLLGSIFPIIILATKKLSHQRSWQILASACALVGVFTMRYIIVIIGQHLPIS